VLTAYACPAHRAAPRPKTFRSRGRGNDPANDDSPEAIAEGPGKHPQVKGAILIRPPKALNERIPILKGMKRSSSNRYEEDPWESFKASEKFAAVPRST